MSSVGADTFALEAVGRLLNQLTSAQAGGQQKEEGERRFSSSQTLPKSDDQPVNRTRVSTGLYVTPRSAALATMWCPNH
jgi:hypothetical protein